VVASCIFCRDHVGVRVANSHCDDLYLFSRLIWLLINLMSPRGVTPEMLIVKVMNSVVSQRHIQQKGYDRKSQ
jgi:hypothetical protein